MVIYVQPENKLEAFNCPHCNAYAHQSFGDAYYGYYEGFGEGNWISLIKNAEVSLCTYCEVPSFWFNKKLIYPEIQISILPHEDLPSELKSDFEEAVSIFNKSPRGATALLRLVIQKLMVELGEKGKNINEDIASLVQKGLSPTIQQALDYCRVVGNSAVHPAELNVGDTPEIARVLFDLINFIVEDRVSRPKHIQQLYDGLPENIKGSIEKRDLKNKDN